MKKIVIYVSKKVDKDYKDYLQKNIKHKEFEFIFEQKENDFEYYKEAVMLLQQQKVERVIAIDDFGTLPFMVMAKHKGIVVAQISDYHSARMTIQHNNSNVLALASYCIARENMVDIINSYLSAHFEAGRHMVRINMLENILEGEK